MEQILGLPSKEILGKHFTSFIAKEYREDAREHFKSLRDKNFDGDYYEFPVLTGAGNTLWVGQSTNLYKDEHGNINGFFAIARPITKMRSIESSLSESEAKLKTIINSALDAVIVINEEGKITEWNLQAEKTFGWSKDRVLGTRLSETIIPTEFREAHERGMKHFLKTGEGPVLNQRIEITAVNSMGTIFPVELTIIPNQIDGVYFFSSFVRDLTEVKKSEKLLKAVNDLAISLLGKATIEEIAWEITKNTIEELGFEDCVVYVLDEEAGILHQAAAYGPKQGEENTVIDPIQIPLGKGVVGKVAKIGEAIIIDDTSKIENYIIDDNMRYSELAVPIVEGDKVIGVIDSEHPDKNFYTKEHLDTLRTIAGMVSTQLGNAILEQKRLEAEQSLRESEERWYKLVDNQPEAIQISNEGKVIYLNPAGMDLYEADSLDQIIGKNLLDLSTADLRQTFEERLALLRKGEKVPALEFEITTFKGNRRIIEAASTPVIYNGEEVIQTIARDITKKKEEEAKKEELLKNLELANDQLKEFAHVVSHDLKAPLRAISSLSEWIVEDYKDKLDEDGLSSLNMLVENVEKMDELIEGILTYSTTSGEADLDELIDTGEVLNSIISLLTVPGHISVNFDPKEFPGIRFNRIQLTQIFQNLISNALKFLNKEKGYIDIGFKDDGTRWIFSVSDNGPGISEDVGDDVFNLFSNFHDSKDGSTGIGLSIIKKIMDNRGERVWFESELDKGTTFYFTIKKTNNERSEISLTS